MCYQNWESWKIIQKGTIKTNVKKGTALHQSTCFPYLLTCFVRSSLIYLKNVCTFSQTRAARTHVTFPFSHIDLNECCIHPPPSLLSRKAHPISRPFLNGILRLCGIHDQPRWLWLGFPTLKNVKHHPGGDCD